MSIPGTSVYVNLNLSATYVKTTETNFLFMFPLALITSASFWAQVSTAANIGVWDVGAGLKRSRYIGSFIDIVNKNGVIYWDAPLTTTGQFKICAGLGLSEVDSLSAFTNSSYDEFWPLCETAGTSFWGINKSLTASGGITPGINGKFYKSVTFDGTNGYLYNASSVLGTGSRTIDFLMYVNAYGSYGNIFSAPKAGGAHSPSHYLHNSNQSLTYQNDNTATGKSAISSIAAGSTYHVALQIIDPNKCTFFINGARSGTAEQVIGNIGAQVSFQLGKHYAADYPNYFNGRMEQFGMSTVLVSENNILTRYNMEFNPSTFYGGNFTPVVNVPISSSIIINAAEINILLAKILNSTIITAAPTVTGLLGQTTDATLTIDSATMHGLLAHVINGEIIIDPPGTGGGIADDDAITALSLSLQLI
jgi:hypothetical protein